MSESVKLTLENREILGKKVKTLRRKTDVLQQTVMNLQTSGLCRLCGLGCGLHALCLVSQLRGNTQKSPAGTAHIKQANFLGGLCQHLSDFPQPFAAKLETPRR